MDIEELKKERDRAEKEIQNTINSILLDFAKKTGLFISYVYVSTSDEIETIDGYDIVKIDHVNCDVKW